MAPVIAVAIWLLSSRTKIPLPEGIVGLDKLAHFAAYALLAAATGLWISPDAQRKGSFRGLLLAAGIAAAYGIIDEVHQSFVPGRDASIYDWAADLLGASAGGWGIMRDRSAKPDKES